LLPLFEAEPIRFRRTADEYAMQIECVLLRDRKIVTYAVRREGRLAAVVSLNPPQTKWTDDSTIAVRELAGERQAVVEALGAIAADLGARQVTIDGYETDGSLREACARLGVRPEIVSFFRTLKLLDARRLWQDFAPLLAERIGADCLAKIGIRQEADDLAVRAIEFDMGGDRGRINTPAGVLAALFGHPTEAPLAEAPGEMARVLRCALPLPLPHYGLNYV
jgi:hypothetical protein